MKPFVLIALIPLLLGANKPWPQKGDVVFVSANTTAISGLFVLTGGPPTQFKTPACSQAKVKKIKKSPRTLWLIETPNGLLGSLEGEAWEARLHHSALECRQFLAANPDPEVSSGDGANFIVGTDDDTDH
jgi:hypothetical protein